MVDKVPGMEDFPLILSGEDGFIRVGKRNYEMLRSYFRKHYKWEHEEVTRLKEHIKQLKRRPKKIEGTIERLRKMYDQERDEMEIKSQDQFLEIRKYREQIGELEDELETNKNYYIEQIETLKRKHQEPPEMLKENYQMKIVELERKSQYQINEIQRLTEKLNSNIRIL